MPPTVFAALARHGSYHQPEGVPSAHLAHALDADGHRQARRLAGELLALAETRRLALHRTIDASSLLRAWQTASVVAEAWHASLGEVEVASYDDLAERSLGAMANLTIEQIERCVALDPRHEGLAPGWKAARDTRLPFIGAESLRQAGMRVAQYLQNQMAKLAQSAQVDTLKLFVGHGAAFRHACCELGSLAEDHVAALSMHHCRAVVFEVAGGGTRWTHVAGEWKHRTTEASGGD